MHAKKFNSTSKSIKLVNNNNPSLDYNESDPRGDLTSPIRTPVGSNNCITLQAPTSGGGGGSEREWLVGGRSCIDIHIQT